MAKNGKVVNLTAVSFSQFKKLGGTKTIRTGKIPDGVGFGGFGKSKVNNNLKREAV